MRITLLIAGILGFIVAAGIPGIAANGVVVVRTGDYMTFKKVSVSSTTAATLSAYSTGRGALTCTNSDSTNSVYIGSSTAVTAAGGTSFILLPQSSIQILNNSSIYAIGSVGIATTTVYCATEN